MNRKAPGFKPCTCQVKHGFKVLPFKMQRAPLRHGRAQGHRAVGGRRADVRGSGDGRRKDARWGGVLLYRLNPVEPIIA
jgi:hypothetical protein